MKRLKIKKFRRSIMLIAAGIVAIALCVVVFVLYLSQKKTYVVADLFITGGEWWWVTSSPPYWLGEPVQRGAVEYNISGKKIVEILDVQKFDELNRKTMVVKARLLVTKDFRTKKYRFQQNPLEIGATIEISPGSVQMYANVIGIQGVQNFDQLQKQTIVVRWYNVFPWQADAIHIGDAMTDNSGKEVLRVLSKDVRDAEKTVVTENNQSYYGAPGKQTGQLVLLHTDPLRRDVTLTLDILTRSSGEQNFFGYMQTIKVGEPLYLSLPNININPQIISFTPPEKL
jgi:hypothetical protein